MFKAHAIFTRKFAFRKPFALKKHALLYLEVAKKMRTFSFCSFDDTFLVTFCGFFFCNLSGKSTFEVGFVFLLYFVRFQNTQNGDFQPIFLYRNI